MILGEHPPKGWKQGYIPGSEWTRKASSHPQLGWMHSPISFMSNRISIQGKDCLKINEINTQVDRYWVRNIFGHAVVNTLLESDPIE